MPAQIHPNLVSIADASAKLAAAQQTATSLVVAYTTDENKLGNQVPSFDFAGLPSTLSAIGTEIDQAGATLQATLDDLNAKLAQAQQDLGACRAANAQLQAKYDALTKKAGAIQQAAAAQPTAVTIPVASGVAVGALVLGGVGGYILRGVVSKRKARAAEALEAGEPEEVEAIEEAPKKRRLKR
jgi:hypothetical protein